MVRIFDEPDIAHVEGNVDPIRDIEIIHDELRLKDLEMAKKVGEDLEKKVVRGNDKTLKIDHVCWSFSNLKTKHTLFLGNRSKNLTYVE